MKNFLIGIAFAAIIFAILPAFRDRQKDGATTSMPEPTPSGSPTNQAQIGQKPAGPSNTGLAGASMGQGPGAAAQTHTLASLRKAKDAGNGQPIRIRFSRPVFTATPAADGYEIVIGDLDVGGSINVLFPTEGVERLNLLRKQNQPGLTFYMALESSRWKALGREWRANTRTYIW
jgi:hypothetical protein